MYKKRGEKRNKKKQLLFLFFFKLSATKALLGPFFLLCLFFSAENGLAVVAHPLATTREFKKQPWRTINLLNWNFWPIMEVSDYRSFTTVFFRVVCIYKVLLSKSCYWVAETRALSKPTGARSHWTLNVYRSDCRAITDTPSYSPAVWSEPQKTAVRSWDPPEKVF